ncbi:MAG: preprotein translocase subunit SecA [Gloeobacterales cyanobacterium]
MLNFLGKVLGDPQKRKVKQYQPMLDRMNSLESEIKRLSDDELKGKTAQFKERVSQAIAGQNLAELEIQDRRKILDAALEPILPEAFAVVREAAQRVLGMRHYDVQMLGGIVLHQGQIAEMKTGEGKTLVSTLPAYLNGLTGQGVHIVTVNDYLARRDSEWMGQVHRFLGLQVGLIQNEMSPQERQRNYGCDITYATNSELGFDYLRDNMATSLEEVVQRRFNYCIIDEVDSILIDEARTPLIISGQVAKPAQKYQKAAAIAEKLKKNEHYEVDEKARNATLTDEGYEVAEKLLGVTDLFDPKDPWAHYVFNAIKAKELFIKDVQYIVRNDEVVIVDEFTGRVMPGRRWSDGLHQAIEAKEDTTIQNETQTLASITYQNFFLLYPKLAGMTGTALTEEAELGKIYNLEVTPIPTNRNVIRTDLSDRVYKAEMGKWQAVADEVEEIHKQGRPILVGTTSVEKSEVLAALLKERGIGHNLLNAKPENVERESEIVAQAGRRGAVTIATNMAGRGTDILLGGNAEYMARLKVREDLMPALRDPEEENDPLAPLTRRNSAQGFGGGAATAQAVSLYPCEISQEAKQLLKESVNFATEQLGARTRSFLEVEEMISIASEKAPTEDPVIAKLREAFNKIYAEYKHYTEQEHEEVVELGGLHVIGTERHESRRVDNQLRGRSGRQGDPGSTRFYLSLQDNLLRIFGGDRVSGMMDAFRVEEDMPIESKMLTKTLENAQRKVETYFYDTRKQVFEYDEVMNNQRKAIYAQRRNALEGGDTRAVVIGYIEETMEEVVNAFINPEIPPEEWNLTALIEAVQKVIPLLSDLKPEQLRDLNLVELIAEIKRQSLLAYEAKEASINSLQPDMPDLMRYYERQFILQEMDSMWREHLQQMEALREAIGLRGYGQKDPLVEYKNEGYQMFLEMLEQIRRNVMYKLYNFQPNYAQSNYVTEAEFENFGNSQEEEEANYSFPPMLDLRFLTERSSEERAQIFSKFQLLGEEKTPPEDDKSMIA